MGLSADRSCFCSASAEFKLQSDSVQLTAPYMGKKEGVEHKNMTRLREDEVH